MATSRSITGRNDFTDNDASALKRLLDKHVHFRKRVSVEEQRSQKYERFLPWRPIAHVIDEHFRATPELFKRFKDTQICSVFVC